MRSRSELFPRQELARAKMVEGKQVAIFLRPGAGKTGATLTALHDLGRPKTLVLAPALVAATVWHVEAARWEHLRGMRVVPCVGTPRQRLAILASKPDVVVLSYENLPWLLKSLDLAAHFQAVVFDELSKMKTPGTSRFRRLRHAIRKIPIRIGLTGTPVGNHLMDIWGEMFMVADEKPLGPSFVEFQYRYFQPAVVHNGVVIKWNTLGHAENEIHARIKPWAFTLPDDRPQGQDPEVNVIHVPLPKNVERAIEEIKADLTTQLPNGVPLTVFASMAAAMKARQLAGGAVYLMPPLAIGEPVPTQPKWEHVHDAKLDALENLVDELQGEPLLVFFWFRHELERILKRFPQAREMSARMVEPWNRREVEILVAHPASAGHGLNLQQGGHNIGWFSLPDSHEMWQQAHGRLDRPGQTRRVQSHVFLAGAVDRWAMERLHHKGAVEARLLQAMLD